MNIPLPNCFAALAIKRLRAFTLVEILAVLAVFGVLVAILVPALGNMRTKAGTTQTVSNLRQVFATFTSYAMDNQGRLPAPRDGDIHWNRDALFPYINDGQPASGWRSLENTIFTSPNAPAIGERDNPAAPVVASAGNQGFGMNNHLPDPDFPEGGFDSDRQGRTLLVHNLSRTMLAMDSNAPILWGAPFFLDQYTTYIGNRHRGHNVVLFCDGHVETIEHARFDPSHPEALVPWFSPLGTRASIFWRGR